MTQFDLKGADELLRKLRALPKNIAQKHLTRSARGAMAIVRDAAKANALKLDDPHTAVVIADSVYMKIDRRRSRTEGGVVVRVGVENGYGRYANTKHTVRKQRVGKLYERSGDAYHWIFLELGTEKMAAKPFLGPALEANIENVTDAFMQGLNSALDQELSR